MKSEILQQNLQKIHEKIAAAASRVDRDLKEIELVAVTKSVSVDIIHELCSLGVKNIGENRVHDAKDKHQETLEHFNVTWHMIGHLQRNKVALALQIFDMFHSIDSLRLAKEINKRAQRVIPILLEVNVSGEASKHGFEPDALVENLPQLRDLEYLKICGLMCMAPFTEDMGICRNCFRETRILANKLRDKGYIQEQNLQLSMGMSRDFEVAIEEGATLVRVGSALFRE